MPPIWLNVVAWFALALGFASAAWILIDLYGRGYRQPMRVMEAVWPITALYLGPLAVWGYQRFGRPRSDRWLPEHRREEAPGKPDWATTAVAANGPCGRSADARATR
jgi:hypothetical protein